MKLNPFRVREQLFFGTTAFTDHVNRPFNPSDLYAALWHTSPAGHSVTGFRNNVARRSSAGQRTIFFTNSESETMWCEVEVTRRASFENSYINAHGNKEDGRGKRDARVALSIHHDDLNDTKCPPIPEMPTDAQEVTDLAEIERVIELLRTRNAHGSLIGVNADDTGVWCDNEAMMGFFVPGSIGILDGATATVTTSTLRTLQRLARFSRWNKWGATVKSWDNGVNAFIRVEFPPRETVSRFAVTLRLSRANPDDVLVRDAMSHTLASQRAACIGAAKTFRNRLSAAVTLKDQTFYNRPVALDIDGTGVTFDGRKAQVPVRGAKSSGMARVHVRAIVMSNLLATFGYAEVCITLAGAEDPIVIASESGDVAVVLLPMVAEE